MPQSDLILALTEQRELTDFATAAMKNTLVETVGFSFTSPVIAQLSSLVDETEPDIEKALHQSVPLVLNRLTSWVGQGLTPMVCWIWCVKPSRPTCSASSRT